MSRAARDRGLQLRRVVLDTALLGGADDERGRSRGHGRGGRGPAVDRVAGRQLVQALARLTHPIPRIGRHLAGRREQVRLQSAGAARTVRQGSPVQVVVVLRHEAPVHAIALFALIPADTHRPRREAVLRDERERRRVVSRHEQQLLVTVDQPLRDHADRVRAIGEQVGDRRDRDGLLEHDEIDQRVLESGDQSFNQAVGVADPVVHRDNPCSRRDPLEPSLRLAVPDDGAHDDRGVLVDADVDRDEIVLPIGLDREADRLTHGRARVVLAEDADVGPHDVVRHRLLVGEVEVTVRVDPDVVRLLVPHDSEEPVVAFRVSVTVDVLVDVGRVRVHVEASLRE